MTTKLENLLKSRGYNVTKEDIAAWVKWCRVNLSLKDTANHIHANINTFKRYRREFFEAYPELANVSIENYVEKIAQLPSAGSSDDYRQHQREVIQRSNEIEISNNQLRGMTPDEIEQLQKSISAALSENYSQLRGQDLKNAYIYNTVLSLQRERNSGVFKSIWDGQVISNFALDKNRDFNSDKDYDNAYKFFIRYVAPSPALYHGCQVKYSGNITNFYRKRVDSTDTIDFVFEKELSKMTKLDKEYIALIRTQYSSVLTDLMILGVMCVSNDFALIIRDSGRTGKNVLVSILNNLSEQPNSFLKINTLINPSHSAKFKEQAPRFQGKTFINFDEINTPEQIGFLVELLKTTVGQESEVSTLNYSSGEVDFRAFQVITCNDQNGIWRRTIEESETAFKQRVIFYDNPVGMLQNNDEINAGADHLKQKYDRFLDFAMYEPDVANALLKDFLNRHAGKSYHDILSELRSEIKYNDNHIVDDSEISDNSEIINEYSNFNQSLYYKVVNGFYNDEEVKARGLVSVTKACKLGLTRAVAPLHEQAKNIATSLSKEFDETDHLLIANLIYRHTYTQKSLAEKDSPRLYEMLIWRPDAPAPEISAGTLDTELTPLKPEHLTVSVAKHAKLPAGTQLPRHKFDQITPVSTIKEDSPLVLGHASAVRANKADIIKPTFFGFDFDSGVPTTEAMLVFMNTVPYRMYVQESHSSTPDKNKMHVYIPVEAPEMTAAQFTQYNKEALTEFLGDWAQYADPASANIVNAGFYVSDKPIYCNNKELILKLNCN